MVMSLGYRLTMSRPILRYPDGTTGVALLLMRLSAVLIAFPTLHPLLPDTTNWWPAAVPPACVAILLAVGLGTRWAAISLIIAAAALFIITQEHSNLLLASAVSVVALALLGPGAYSIDAHLFGRQVIRLEPRSPDRGGRT